MKKYLLVALTFFVFSSESVAQFDFGVKLEFNQSSPNTKLTDWTANNLDGTLENIIVKDNIGFGLGLLLRYFSSERWAISTQPNISFNQANLSYFFDSGVEEVVDINSVQLQVPLQLECHFQGIPLRPYLLSLIHI